MRDVVFIAFNSARSGNLVSPSARRGDYSTKRRSSASEVSPTASPKDNKAALALRSRSKKTKIRRKKGVDARSSVRLPRIVLHQHTSFQNLPFCFTSSLLRVQARSSKSAGSCVFRI